jgi:hypothetical protein
MDMGFGFGRSAQIYVNLRFAILDQLASLSRMPLQINCRSAIIPS